jgi:desulfoferrodoxin (superoxide reductase-like protein)
MNELAKHIQVDDYKKEKYVPVIDAPERNRKRRNGKGKYISGKSDKCLQIF